MEAVEPTCRQRLAELFTPEVLRICDAFARCEPSYSVRIVGGAVRDALRHEAPADIDLVTDCPGDVMEQVCTDGGMKCRLMRGGRREQTSLTTIIIIFEESGQQFELSSLQLPAGSQEEDIWQSDAAVREFTMNAMSADPSGQLFDYFDGAAHLAQHRVVWVGSVRERILEAPFRMLRYFRFHGRMLSEHGGASPPHDVEVLQAMSAERQHLQTVSREVRWKLFRQILKESGAYAVTHEFATMCEHGLLLVLLPQAVHAEEVLSFDLLGAEAMHRQQLEASKLPLEPRVWVAPVLTLSALLRFKDVAVRATGEAWKWSKEERKLGALLCDAMTRGHAPSAEECCEPSQRHRLSMFRQLFVAQNRLDELVALQGSAA